MANLKNYLQSARKENKTVDTIELTNMEEQRRTALVHKLTQGTISLAEAQELRTLLERERHMLTQQGNCLAFFAARFLADYIDEYLQSKSNSILTSGS
ncbi:MAG TPA: hypothetical protein VFR94_01820 [Nitrososphaeraceae archaeon]|nr:hypothetical protein [Nitrososphaeraceae archaeon]